MEVKIKQGSEMLDATIEMVDGVMVVLPKEMKVDVSKFKDGDVITCGHDTYHWTCILRGEIEYIIDNMLIDDYCGINSDGTYYLKPASSDAAIWVRYSTEEEKKKLFDKLAEEGWEWKPDTKELVKLKWKPKDDEPYFYPSMYKCDFVVNDDKYENHSLDICRYAKGWCFKTQEECQEFCNRLNDAINSVKP